ncbi:hypothetical protein NBCG_00587 [Nocardioidaceae bacterium Broad-1]|nr:hypothetical protein NBCG_00587 [Nocardioidaceae bacterium Broad-1]
MWGRRSIDLDVWAEALGVHNDADAIAELRKLCAQLQGITTELHKISNRLPDRGRSATYAEEARNFVGTAAEGLYEAHDGLFTIAQAFGRHERGEI